MTAATDVVAPAELAASS